MEKFLDEWLSNFLKQATEEQQLLYEMLNDIEGTYMDFVTGILNYVKRYPTECDTVITYIKQHPRSRCSSSDVIEFVTNRPLFWKDHYIEEGRLQGVYTIAFRIILWEHERVERVGLNVVDITNLPQSTIEDIVKVCKYMSDQAIYMDIVRRTNCKLIDIAEQLRLEAEVRQEHLENLLKDERYKYLEGAIKDVFCKCK